MKLTMEDLRNDPSIAYVCGVDESGLGAIAGPIGVGCTVLPVNSTLAAKDSKKYTTDKARNKAYDLVKATAEFGMVELAQASDIDKYGMSKAKDFITFKLLERAVEFYSKEDTVIILDGAYIPKKLPAFLDGYRVYAVPKADVFITAVSAASILAKVIKDRFLLHLVENDLSLQHYGFKENRGYCTAGHLAALKEYGPSNIHRVSTAPVKAAMLYREHNE
jgi:ribonuclease HII